MKVAVIMGGHTYEHQWSLASGQTALRALASYNPLPIIIDEDLQTWHLQQPMSATKALAYLKTNIDVVFLALHGPYGEDGSIQRALETVNLPYTGSDVFASATAMSKSLSGLLFKEAGLATPEFVSFTKHTVQQAQSDIASLGFPLVVKPENGSPAEGVSFVDSWGDLLYAIYSKPTTDFIAQEYIEGEELTCSVFDTKELPKASPVFKRLMNHDEPVPAEIPSEITMNIQEMALKAHSLFGCNDISQSNFILNDRKPYILGLKTLPHLMETRLITQQLAETGLELDEFLLNMCRRAYDKRSESFKTALGSLYQKQSSSFADVASALRRA